MRGASGNCARAQVLLPTPRTRRRKKLCRGCRVSRGMLPPPCRHHFSTNYDGVLSATPRRVNDGFQVPRADNPFLPSVKSAKSIAARRRGSVSTHVTNVGKLLARHAGTPMRRYARPLTMTGVSIRLPGGRSSELIRDLLAVFELLPGIEQPNIEASKVLHIAGDKGQVMLKGSGRDLRIGCGRATAGTIPVSHESPPDCRGRRVKRQDAPVELPGEILFYPSLKSFTTGSFSYLPRASDELPNRLCR